VAVTRANLASAASNENALAHLFQLAVPIVLLKLLYYVVIICLVKICRIILDRWNKGKPAEKWGRKATGAKAEMHVRDASQLP